MMINGPRIKLRAIEREDLEAIRSWYNNPEISRGLGDTTYPTATHEQEKWLDRIQSQHDTKRFAIEDEQENLIGITGFWNIHVRDRRAEHAVIIGANPTAAKGYGQETINTCASYAFQEMNLHRLDATILATNLPSIKAYEACGFVREGTIRKHAFRGGTWIDRHLYGLLKDEFNPAQHHGPNS